jgi:hypothetical protein
MTCVHYTKRFYIAYVSELETVCIMVGRHLRAIRRVRDERVERVSHLAMQIIFFEHPLQ